MEANTLEVATPQEQEESAIPENLVGMDINSLIIGRPLRFPIYDQNSRLLLAEGSVISSEFKHLLEQRNLDHVQLHAEDVSQLTLAAEHVEADVILDFGRDITEKLDSIIDSGQLFVTSAGTAVRKQMVQHGCRGYDLERRDELVQNHAESGKRLDGMMKNALRGEVVDTNQISVEVASYLSDLTDDADSVLSIAVELARHRTLSQHCVQMALLGMAIGAELSLDANSVRKIGLTGLLHDWGMLRVPEAIRNANRPLTEIELLEIKKHPIHSLEILEPVASISGIIPLVSYQVHERPDGSGYPRGKTSRNIHLFAKILHVADAYLAMTAERPYRSPLMGYAAMECLLRQSAQNVVDADVVRALLHVLGLFPIGSYVALTDGSAACVLRRNGDRYNEPIVRVIQNSDGERLDPQSDEYVIDLAVSDLGVMQALPTPGRKEVRLSNHLNRVVR